MSPITRASGKTAAWPPDWTAPLQLKQRMQRLWESGPLARAVLGDELQFPLRVVLKGPASRDWAAHFAEIPLWIQALEAGADKQWQLEWRELAHRDLGKNSIPVAAIIPDLGAALSLAGKQPEARQLQKLHADISSRWPVLAGWAARQPHVLLYHAEDWPALLSCLDWFAAHPQTACFSRAIAAPGVHGKFVETHRALLGELLDLALPGSVKDSEQSGARNFNRRYGLLDRPELVRLRFLDSELAPALFESASLLPAELTLRADDFAAPAFGIALAARRLRQVLVLENEISWLSLPSLPGTVAVLGSGYGFSHVASADWMRQTRLWYWGDLDSHGFAILSQFRALFPQARSLLMDLPTLQAHLALCTDEPKPSRAQPESLTETERQAWIGLSSLQPGRNLRLEQERLNWTAVLAALEFLRPPV